MSLFMFNYIESGKGSTIFLPITLLNADQLLTRILSLSDLAVNF